MNTPADPAPAPRKPRRRVRRVLAMFAAGLALALLALQSAKWACDRHFYDGYDPALPCNLKIRSEQARPAYRRILFQFTGVPGRPVPTLLALPRPPGPAKAPLIIFLHGIGQRKEFLDRIAPFFTKNGFAMACFDQYTRGERKLHHAGIFKQALAFRRRAALTVIETRRLIDCLEKHWPARIDEKRIFLVGASYGAITGCTAAAFEPRIRAAVLCYGGGGLENLFDSREVRKVLGRATRPLGALVAWWMAPADPLRYAANIAPRPVLCQNGRRDGLISQAAAKALHQALKPPKKIIWYDSDHVGMNEANTRKVLRDVLAWLQHQVQPRAGTGSARDRKSAPAAPSPAPPPASKNHQSP